MNGPFELNHLARLSSDELRGLLRQAELKIANAEPTEAERRQLAATAMALRSELARRVAPIPPWLRR